MGNIYVLVFHNIRNIGYDIYYNSGVLMIDTDKLKEELMRHKASDVLHVDKNIVDLGKFYGNLYDYLEMVKKSFVRTIFVIGQAGLGKTCFISNALSGTKAVRISGHISPRRLYRKLYENRNEKIIFFDDTESMLNNKISIVILKQALDTGTKRIVSWDSTKTTDIPSSFEFESSVIFCLNAIPSDLGFQAIISRAVKMNVWFSYNQIIELMEEIAKYPRNINGATLTPSIRNNIVDWIRKNCEPSVDDFSLRTQHKIESFYAYSELKWKDLAFELLHKKNELIGILLDIMNKYPTRKEQIKIWKQMTNLSERAYYRHMRKLTDKLTPKNKSMEVDKNG